MARLTEEMVIARSRQSDLSSVKKLNCWGAELGDVSLLRRMPNVEVLALSLNKIRSLSEFAHLERLRELYVRKNDVRSLSDVRYLRHLPHLSSLWLEDNPCADRADYRHTVLRNLPRLTRLDNRPVEPEEVEDAQRLGVLFADSDEDADADRAEDWGAAARGRTAAEDHSPDRYARQQSGEWAEGAAEAAESPARPQQTPHASPPRRGGAGGGAHSPDSDERYQHPAALTRSYHERSSGGGEEERAGSGHSANSALRHSLSAHSVKAPPHPPMRHAEEYGGSNGDCRHSSGSVCSPPHHAPAPASAPYPYPHHHNGAAAYHDAYYERGEREAHVAARCPADAWDRDRERDSAREYPSAVMAEHRGFTRRPVTRNSNLLSAVLCLVKELDYASLEVAEMAVRCRMDELAHGP